MKIISKDTTQDRGVISILYGLPKVGKTTLACSQPGRVLLLDLERGAIGIKTDRIELEAYELNSNEVAAEIAKYDTIVIDSMSKIEQYFSHCIVRDHNQLESKKITNPSQIPYGGAKGAYITRYTMFAEWVKKLSETRKNIILIAHQALRTATDPLTGKDFDTCEPLLEKNGSAVLLADVDIIAYMRQQRAIDAEGCSTTSDKVLVHVDPEAGIIIGHRLPCLNKQDRSTFKFPKIS